MNLETRHSFDIAIACEVGVNKAIILKEVMGWCEQNRRNNRNQHDGEYWTYNSSKAYAAKFPYLKPSSISRWMNELVDDEWLYKGSYAPAGYDRTLSHRVNREKYLEALQSFISQNEKTISQNEKTISQNETPITSSTTPSTSKANSNELARPKRKKKIFEPPTREDVARFMADKLQAKKAPTPRFWAWEESLAFIEHYELADWRKKDGAKMTNWKQAAAGWINRGWSRGEWQTPHKKGVTNGKPGGSYTAPTKTHAAPFAK